MPVLQLVFLGRLPAEGVVAEEDAEEVEVAGAAAAAAVDEPL